MITKAEADKLRQLIGQHTSARCDAEWAGSQPPEEAQALRNDAREATRKLGRYIRTLEGKDDPYPDEDSLVG